MGSIQSEEILFKIAERERDRVQADERAAAITPAVLQSLDVLKGLDIKSFQRTAAAIKPIHAFFRGGAFFSELSPVQQVDCCQCFKRVSLSRQEVLFEQGEVGDLFYVVAAGKVAVLINGREVRQKTLGECFGEVSLQQNSTSGERRNASVVAMEPCELAVLSRPDYLRIMGFQLEDVWPVLGIPVGATPRNRGIALRWQPR